MKQLIVMNIIKRIYRKVFPTNKHIEFEITSDGVRFWSKGKEIKYDLLDVLRGKCTLKNVKNILNE